MEYSITAQNGDSVKVEAENWMLAMGKAMTFFQVDIGEMGRMVCSPGNDGSVFVDSPGNERSWMLRPIQPRITVVAAAASPEAQEEEEPPPQPEEEEVVSATPPPSLSMPVTSSLKREVEDIESLAERLFDLSMDLAGADPDDACQMALDLVLEFVDVEAASVARGTLNDPALRFVAATGPVAEKITNTTVQFGEGIIGSAYDLGGTVIVADVAEEARHLHHIDDNTGFVTRSAMCVPIVGDDGQTYGVVELLNPADGEFTPVHVETVETIARTLAGVLSASVM